MYCYGGHSLSYDYEGENASLGRHSLSYEGDNVLLGW